MRLFLEGNIFAFFLVDRFHFQSSNSSLTVKKWNRTFWIFSNLLSPEIIFPARLSLSIAVLSQFLVKLGNFWIWHLAGLNVWKTRNFPKLKAYYFNFRMFCHQKYWLNNHPLQLGSVHKWRHGLGCDGVSRILWQQY